MGYQGCSTTSRGSSGSRMRKKLAKETKRQFAAKLALREPRFTIVRAADLPVADVLYEFRAPGLSSFVALLIAHKRDAFSVELGWSRCGLWPAHLVPLMGEPGLDRPEGRVRLHRLVSPTARVDEWWELVKEPDVDDLDGWLAEPATELEALPITEPLVEDAMCKLVMAGKNFFGNRASPWCLRASFLVTALRIHRGRLAS